MREILQYILEIWAPIIVLKACNLSIYVEKKIILKEVHHYTFY